MTPYTDDDVQRGATPVHEQLDDLALTWDACDRVARAVLDAVLPSYTARILRELAKQYLRDEPCSRCGGGCAFDWMVALADEYEAAP